MDDRLPDRDPLAEPARKFADWLLQSIAQLQLRGSLPDPLRQVSGHAICSSVVVQTLLDLQRIVEADEVWQEADAFVTSTWLVNDIDIVDVDSPGQRTLQTTQATHQRGFSGTIRTYQGSYGAGLDFKGHAIECTSPRVFETDFVNCNGGLCFHFHDCSKRNCNVRGHETASRQCCFVSLARATTLARMRRDHSKIPEERRIGLARALSKAGLCSRSAASSLIVDGRVQLNGVTIRDPEAPTTVHSHITVDDEPIRSRVPVYIMLNKPHGVVTTAADERGRETVYSCFKDSGLPWIAPVGRLDQASEGLLLFSNDPEWSSAIVDPVRHVPKTYHAQIEGLPTPETLLKLCQGVLMRDGAMLRVDSATLLRHGARNAWLEVVLAEGKNRHLRRLLEAVDHPVVRLIRIAIGSLQLGELAKGHWRHLRAEEHAHLAQG